MVISTMVDTIVVYRWCSVAINTQTHAKRFQNTVKSFSSALNTRLNMFKGFDLNAVNFRVELSWWN